ncbi:hypothetical protein PVAG01_10776 [Phlyctema vagabunda]|uniref:N-acetylgalactosaminide beta-1,3-galactosyltransferase n=1 Tax=Phlyctema vagabunda TaxID=108571 RepID=A0ABR4P375_9HELO
MLLTFLQLSKTMMRWPVRSSAVWLRACIIGTFFILATFFLFPQDNTRLRASPAPNVPSGTNPCTASPPTDKIVVSVKSGATEALDRIPVQMRTALRCVQHVLLFSDLEQDLGQYHLHDALDTVSATVVDSNPDFKFYTRQYELWQSDQDVGSLKGAKSPGSPNDLAAWVLDKYKNLHILEKTWALKPDMDWYVFIDADTYVIWSNLVLWLGTLSPSKKSYFGSEVSISGVRFAHGGSGIILSRAAMYELAVIHNGTAAHWDAMIRERCCGDLVLGLALKELGTELQDVWPTMSGEAPATMPFGPGTPEYWCRPALTMHHLSPSDMSDLSSFEMQRLASGIQSPLSHAEIFKEFLLDEIQSSRDDWDNLAADPGEFGKTGGILSEMASFEDCARTCEANLNCFQYSHNGNRCHVGMSVRLGYKKQANEDGMWRSGWNKTRLGEWILKQPLCEQIKFPGQGS